MTRILKVVMLVSLAVGLLPRQQASGQVAQQKSARKPHPKQELKWESLGEGARVLRLWRSSLSPEQLQVAVLELEKQESSKFTADPTQYLKNYKVFGDSKLRGVVSMVDLSVTQRDKSPDDPPKGKCTFVVSHTSWCTSAVIYQCY